MNLPSQEVLHYEDQAQWDQPETIWDFHLPVRRCLLRRSPTFRYDTFSAVAIDLQGRSQEERVGYSNVYRYFHYASLGLRSGRDGIDRTLHRTMSGVFYCEGLESFLALGIEWRTHHRILILKKCCWGCAKEVGMAEINLGKSLLWSAKQINATDEMGLSMSKWGTESNFLKC